MAEVRNAYVKARDLDTPVLDARLVARLWHAGRAAHDAAIGEPDGAAGPWAGDAAVADRALLQRAAHVSAGAGQGIHRSVCPVQQDRYAARVGPAELPIGSSVSASTGVPARPGPAPGRRASVPGRATSEARYRLSAVVFSAACTRPTRVSGPGGVGPVVQPGSCGRHGGHHAGSHQQICGPLGGRAAGGVSQHHRRRKPAGGPTRARAPGTTRGRPPGHSRGRRAANRRDSERISASQNSPHEGAVAWAVRHSRNTRTSTPT
jgi:hypothetical protein